MITLYFADIMLNRDGSCSATDITSACRDITEKEFACNIGDVIRAYVQRMKKAGVYGVIYVDIQCTENDYIRVIKSEEGGEE